MLVRAFDRAWEQYYRRQYLTIDPKIVRGELAKQIVQLARAGERDEGGLALGGLIHLNSLTRALQLRGLLIRRGLRDRGRPTANQPLAYQTALTPLRVWEKPPPGKT
jgi:hypothetical protein